MAANYNPVFVDPIAEEQFTREGYLVVPMLSPAEVESLTSLYYDTVPELPSDFFSTAFLPDGAPRRTLTTRVREVLGPHVERLTRDYSIFSLGYVAKRGGPDQAPLPLHQDYTYVDESTKRAVHFWIPLLDVEEANGCLTVVPRSHHLVEHISAAGINPSPYDPIRPILDKQCTLPLPIKAGTAIFFDQRLLHGSRPNRSASLRLALACTLLPTGLEARIYVMDEEHPSHFTILNFPHEFAIKLGANMKLVPPYPEGVHKIGETTYVPEVLTPEKIEFLKLKTPEATPAAPTVAVAPPEKKGFFSSLFGSR